jgi:acetoin utilization protein AcuB
MRLQDIMNRSVETISPKDSLVVANELMWRKRFHHLVVMDGQQVVGVLSDTDLGGDQEQQIPDNQRVQDVMSANTVVADPQMTVDRAINIFRERNMHCLPVLENGRLVGIVTATDIIKLAKRGAPNSNSSGPYPPLNGLSAF